MKMGPKEAWLYAAQWGSAMTTGDPGALMYGFSEDFQVQSEQHRVDCLAYVAECRGFVVANPSNYDADELDKLDALAEALKLAPCEGAESELDEFTSAYVAALFWTDNAVGVTTDEWQAIDDHDEGSIPGDVDVRDLAPDALAGIVADCLDFQAKAADLLILAEVRGYGLERAGHDFWLTRNGHGTGFWDRTELEPDDAEYERLTTIMVEAGNDNAAWNKACSERSDLKAQSLGAKLTAIAKGFGEVDSYLGDDGKVYV
jgi:hypothetical protein